MSNGRVNPHVPKVHLNDDNSVDLVVQIVGFAPGSWAEISGYITQSTGAFAPFSAIEEVTGPVSADGTFSLTVTVRPMKELNLAEDVEVITRVTEVQIWPTMLGRAEEQGIKATWLAKDDTPALTGRASPQGSQSEEVWATPGTASQVIGPMPRTGLTAAARFQGLEGTSTWQRGPLQYRRSARSQSESPVKGLNGTTYLFSPSPQSLPGKGGARAHRPVTFCASVKGKPLAVR